jgi:hypothetical protein
MVEVRDRRALIAIALAVFGERRGALGDLVRQAYAATPDTGLGRAFAWLASSRGLLPVDFYLGRVYLAYRWANALVGLTAVILGAVLLAHRYTMETERLRRWIADVLAPSPSLPAFTLPAAPITKAISVVILPGILLGMLTAVRIVGPLAGALVVVAFLLQHKRRSWLPIGFYLGVAGLTALACWPYLWPEPAARFAGVLRHMADNPKLLPVLYAGTVYASNELPVGYMPRLLALTLTEPVWPLAVGGLVVGCVRFVRRQIEWRTWVTIAWLLADTHVSRAAGDVRRLSSLPCAAAHLHRRWIGARRARSGCAALDRRHFVLVSKFSVSLSILIRIFHYNTFVGVPAPSHHDRLLADLLAPMAGGRV